MQNERLTLIQGVVVVVAMGTLNGSFQVEIQKVSVCMRWDQVLDASVRDKNAVKMHPSCLEYFYSGLLVILAISCAFPS